MFILPKGPTLALTQEYQFYTHRNTRSCIQPDKRNWVHLRVRVFPYRTVSSCRFLFLIRVPETAMQNNDGPKAPPLPGGAWAWVE